MRTPDVEYSDLSRGDTSDMDIFMWDVCMFCQRGLMQITT